MIGAVCRLGFRGQQVAPNAALLREGGGDGADTYVISTDELVVGQGLVAAVARCAAYDNLTASAVRDDARAARHNTLRFGEVHVWQEARRAWPW